MELDDSNEKIRRNLLVFSFGVVTSAFLDLSLQEKGVFLNTIDLSSVSTLKFWVVITVVLIYLFYRYWFDAGTSSAAEACKSEFSSSRYGYIHALINKDIENSFIKNSEPKFIKEFKELSESDYVQKNKIFGLPVRVRSYVHPELGVSPWNGSINNSYSIEWSGNSYARDGGNRYLYEIPKWEQYLLRCKVIFKIATYSKSVTEFIAPLILFSLAFLICIYELVSCYFYC